MNKHQEALDELFTFAVYDEHMDLSVNEETVKYLQLKKDKLQELVDRAKPRGVFEKDPEDCGCMGYDFMCECGESVRQSYNFCPNCGVALNQVNRDA